MTAGILAETVKQSLDATADATLQDARLGRRIQNGATTQVGNLKLTVLHVRRGKAHMILVERPETV